MLASTLKPSRRETFPLLILALAPAGPCRGTWSCSSQHPAWSSSTSLHPPASSPTTQRPVLWTSSHLKLLAGFSTWQAAPTRPFPAHTSSKGLCHKQADSYPYRGHVLSSFLSLLFGGVTSELHKVFFYPLVITLTSSDVFILNVSVQALGVVLPS